MTRPSPEPDGQPNIPTGRPRSIRSGRNSIAYFSENQKTPAFAFADFEFNARLKAGQVPNGSIIVADNNFGCGSSREQAASCLKA
jgi:aconitase A